MTSGQQEVQQQLVEQGQRLPGVQEVVETYQRLAPYAGVRIDRETTVIRYATGGNS